MIGKIFRSFSNDWKTFSREVFARTMTNQSRPFWKRDNSDNLGQLFHGAPPNRAAAGSAGIPPAGRREREKQAKRALFSVISHPSGAAGSRTSGSLMMLAQKVPRHFRVCGILPPLRMERVREEKVKQDKGGQD